MRWLAHVDRWNHHRAASGRWRWSGAGAAAETPTIAGLAVREQAKGRLSMQLGVDPDSALGYLRRYAVGRQVSLQTAAVQVATGRLRRPLTNP
jgi:hypothetical protein